jgi:hypothetical protein
MFKMFRFAFLEVLLCKTKLFLQLVHVFNVFLQIEAIVMCLTRLQPLLRPESPIHRALFWVSISILQVQFYKTFIFITDGVPK